MKYIITALYCEAFPFIEALKLKKQNSIGKFQIFTSSQSALVITGTGPMNAAIGTTHLLSLYPPVRGDLLINAGVCAATDLSVPCGTLYLCNKIMEHTTGRCFYPDLLFTHPFEEACVKTFGTVVRTLASQDTQVQKQVIDMEAAGVWQAAHTFLQPHQIYILKIISDHISSQTDLRADEGLPSPEKVQMLIHNQVGSILSWSDSVQHFLSHTYLAFTEEELHMIQETIQRLLLSKAMQNQLEQLLRYYKLQGGDVTSLLHDFILKNNFHCQSKKEGKPYFEQLKRTII